MTMRDEVDAILARPFGHVRDGGPDGSMLFQHKRYGSLEEACHSCAQVYSYSQMQAAYSAGQRAEREACIQAVEAESLAEPDVFGEGDHAYNLAIRHAAAAIRNRTEGN